MKYRFDKKIDRKDTYSLKWDIADNELPMWVADMDFETAPAVQQAILNRAQNGAYGYTIIPDEWYDAYISWWSSRYGFDIKKEWLIFSTGVVPAISSIVRKITTPAEKVIVLTPVYNIFFNSIINNGRFPLECPLKVTDNGYQIDFEKFEELCADPQTTLLIFCNPHNPVGIVWDADTLRRVGEICSRNHVTVISDEVHCDLTEPHTTYIPFASVSDTNKEISITCLSPSKSFNVAGTHSAAVVVPNQRLYNKVNRGLNTDEVAEPNIFAIQTAVAAYTEGGEWLDELRVYIFENKKLVADFVKTELPQLVDRSEQATYLSWLDARKIERKGEPLAKFIRKETGLYLSDGRAYGESGEGFLRINVACPRSIVEEGLSRLKQGIERYLAQD